MTERERILKFLTDDNFDELLFLPLAEISYATSLAGKEWITEGTFEDQLAAARKTGYSPIVFPPIDFAKSDAALEFKEVSVTREGDSVTRIYALETPEGTLTRKHIEKPRFGVNDIEQAVKSEKDFPALVWYADRIASGKCDEGIRAQAQKYRRQVGDDALTVVQVGQPFELMNNVLLHDIPVLYLTARDEYMAAVKGMAKAQKHLAKLLIEAGIDLIWMGTPGTELFSPRMMEEAVVPIARDMVDFVHSCGGLVYFHSCGKNFEFINRGYYNQIHPDLFETMSAPPAGDIKDIGWARSKIDPAIRTKGNIDVGLILNGTVEKIVAAGREVIEKTRGTRHALGLSDSVLFGTPLENMRALVDLVNEYN